MPESLRHRVDGYRDRSSRLGPLRRLPGDGLGSKRLELGTVPVPERGVRYTVINRVPCRRTRTTRVRCPGLKPPAYPSHLADLLSYGETWPIHVAVTVKTVPPYRPSLNDAYFSSSSCVYRRVFPGSFPRRFCCAWQHSAEKSRQQSLPQKSRSVSHSAHGGVVPSVRLDPRGHL